MNKSNNVIRNLLSIITIILIIMFGFTQANVSKANTDEGHEDTYSPAGDRTYVRLVHRDNNKVDVYLELADSTIIEGTEEAKPGASVKAFQIGLDIDIDLEDKDSVINFEFDSGLKERKDYDLMKTTKDFKVEEIATGEKVMGEILHIYYAGQSELNDASSTEGIKVGTISFDGIKKLETVTIAPISEFTKIESIGYNHTEVNITENDVLKEILINASTDDSGDDSGSGDEGDSGDQGEDYEGGSGDDMGTEGEGKEDSKGTLGSGAPSTGDIAIGAFVILMVVSFIGLIIMTRKKKPSKHSK